MHSIREVNTITILALSMIRISVIWSFLLYRLILSKNVIEVLVAACSLSIAYTFTWLAELISRIYGEQIADFH